MGSNGPTELSSAGIADDEIVVMVTGFGPFKSQYPINPSWEIVASLPPILSSSKSVPSSPPIRILTHPAPIRVTYTAVRELVPKLWAANPRIDFMVHVGMASGREFYSVERRGHRDGYAMRDVDGELLGDERGKAKRGEGEWVWEGCPDELLSDFDIDDVWMRWKSSLPDLDIRRSEDAGRYLCDFIYYSSLAHLWKMNAEKKVVFFHVPADSDDAAIRTGTEVLIELIRAMVQSRKVKKILEQGK